MAYNESTFTQIIVTIVKTLGDYRMVDYDLKLGRWWGAGGKKINNDVIVLIAKDDRKAFIATPYGMKGPVLDTSCKGIVDNDIIPNFRGKIITVAWKKPPMI